MSGRGRGERAPERLIRTWVLVWGLMYLACAVLSPEVYGTHPAVGAVGSIIVGTTIVLGYVFIERRVGKYLLLAVGGFEVIGATASWTGLIMWDVPFESQGLFQVNMAMLDMISAVFLLYLGLESSYWGEG